MRLKIQLLNYISHISSAQIATCGQQLPCQAAQLENISIITETSRMHQPNIYLCPLTSLTSSFTIFALVPFTLTTPTSSMFLKHNKHIYTWSSLFFSHPSLRLNVNFSMRSTLITRSLATNTLNIVLFLLLCSVLFLLLKPF